MFKELKKQISQKYKRDYISMTLHEIRKLYKKWRVKEFINICNKVLPNFDLCKYTTKEEDNDWNYKFKFRIDKVDYFLYQKLDWDMTIMFEDILIMKSLDFLGLDVEWRHKLPIEMIDKLYEESKIIQGYIKQLKKEYRHYNKYDYDKDYIEEQNRLKEFFVKGND